MAHFGPFQPVSSPDSDSGRSNLPIGRFKPQKNRPKLKNYDFLISHFLACRTTFLIFVILSFGGYIDGIGQNGRRELRDRRILGGFRTSSASGNLNHEILQGGGSKKSAGFVIRFFGMSYVIFEYVIF